MVSSLSPKARKHPVPGSAKVVANLDGETNLQDGSSPADLGNRRSRRLQRWFGCSVFVVMVMFLTVPAVNYVSPRRIEGTWGYYYIRKNMPMPVFQISESPWCTWMRMNVDALRV
jgi:hypothetical protein